MKIVNKKSMDELIRITRKFWDKGEADVLDTRNNYAIELSNQAFGNESDCYSFADLVDSAVKFNKSITNETIYAMFSLAGIFVDQEATA